MNILQILESSQGRAFSRAGAIRCLHIYRDNLYVHEGYWRRVYGQMFTLEDVLADDWEIVDEPYEDKETP